MILNVCFLISGGKNAIHEGKNRVKTDVIKTGRVPYLGISAHKRLEHWESWNMGTLPEKIIHKSQSMNFSVNNH